MIKAEENFVTQQDQPMGIWIDFYKTELLLSLPINILTTLKKQRPDWSANWSRIKYLLWNAGLANPTQVKKEYLLVQQYLKGNTGLLNMHIP